MFIASYDSAYETSWVYCKALAYLFSDFSDDISRRKDQMTDYADSIELIALEGETVIGLLDIGIYDLENSRAYPYYQADKVAYFANLAVHPDHQNKGIAQALFDRADVLLAEKGVQALAIFTRGDDAANHLYQKWGAELICQDWLVVGTPKDLNQDFRFKVLPEEKRLLFQTPDGELPYYQREGIYIVPQEEYLILFDAEQIYQERTYLKIYDN